MCKKLLSGLLGGGAAGLVAPAATPDAARESEAAVNVDNGTSSADGNAGRVRLGKTNRAQQQVAGLSI